MRIRIGYKHGLAAALVLALAALSNSVALAEKFITIGTGGQTGVYYVVGQSICKLVNRGQEQHGIKCTAPSTGGSVANLNAIAAGEQDMGVVQSDWQHHAYKGTDKFESQGPNEELRSVFSVYPEAFTVVARADSGITTFDDLKGKRVNVGNPGSGQRGTLELLMEKKGWTMDDFALASELKSAEQAQALCDNKVDAIVFVVGHPNGSIKEATTACDSVVVPVSGPDVEELVENNAYYTDVVIPGGMYRGTEEDVDTFGVGATFVSSEKVDPEVIYTVVSAVFDNLDRFRRLHPAFANLDENKMITENLSAPLHEGAEKYYKEKGMM